MIKRAFDIAVSLSALFLLFPILALCALGVRLKIGSPILFSQQRPGLGGKPFVMVKFRTMADITDSKGDLLPDGERLGRFGGWLRKTSLDELPELWNVLRGHMSLVGPRPLLIEYLPLYNAEQMRRHEIRPGITGWAQVNGRNALSWDEKFELDVWYVDNQTFWLDVRILLLTVKKVLLRHGVSAPGEATMPKFKGNDGIK